MTPWKVGDLVWVTIEAGNGASLPERPGVVVDDHPVPGNLEYVVQYCEPGPDNYCVAVYGRELRRRFLTDLHKAVWEAVHGRLGDVYPWEANS